MNNWTRKDFLKASLVGGGAALVAGSGRLHAQAPAAARSGSANGDIRVGVVGLNQQGNGHMMNYVPGGRGKVDGAILTAVCDCDSAVLEKRKGEAEKTGNIKVAGYTDYRKMLEDKNVDAVVIATPNHQHSLMAIWALQAGKDVYVEKPLSHNVWEGRQVVEASKKYTKNIIFAGTQNRSSEDIAEAIAYVRSGKLGKIKYARGLCYKQRDSIGKTTGDQKVPASINYDLWTGPADMVQPHRNSPKYGPVHYDWHWFWNYGGGDITNQGIHQMDVARWFLGEKGLPPSVMSFGGRFGYLDDAETPNTLVSVFNYAAAPLIFEVRGLPQKTGMRAMDALRGTRVGVIVQCENGYITVSEAGTCNIFDNDNKRLAQLNKNTLGAHRPNFVKAMNARKVTIGDVTECHYSSALCHLGNVSYLVGAEKTNAALAEAIKADEVTKETFGRVLEHLKANDVNTDTTKTVVGPLLTIDAKTETFVGSDKTILAAANKSALLKREGRGAFKIPVMQSGAVARS